jgi:tetratricopeptide (TPR) repeat protein
MRIELKNLMGLDGTPTFAQTFGITFDNGVEWAEQGLELARDGKLDEARVILEGLVTLNPRSPAYWHALGCVYQQQELHDDAIQAFDQATSRDRQNADAWLRLGTVKLKKGDRSGLIALKTVLDDTRSSSAEYVARARAILASVKH